MASRYKLCVNVPLVSADAVREAIGRAGGGKLGNYSFCSFSIRGTGRFKPEAGANPSVGEVGKMESVEEERIEVVMDAVVLEDVIAAMKEVHPYEEVAYEVYALENF